MRWSRTSGPPATPLIVADASLVCDALAAAGPARDPVQRGALRRDHAEARLLRWAAFAAQRHDARPLLPRAWALCEVLTACDAMYVALAEALRCTLVTGDRRLAGAPGVSCDVRVIGRG